MTMTYFSRQIHFIGMIIMTEVDAINNFVVSQSSYDFFFIRNFTDRRGHIIRRWYSDNHETDMET